MTVIVVDVVVIGGEIPAVDVVDVAVMVVVDAWKESGFTAVAKSYLQWLPTEAGVRRDIDANGDLMVRRMGDVERRPLLPKLAEAAWLDLATRGPRL